MKKRILLLLWTCPLLTADNANALDSNLFKQLFERARAAAGQVGGPQTPPPPPPDPGRALSEIASTPLADIRRTDGKLDIFFPRTGVRLLEIDGGARLLTKDGALLREEPSSVSLENEALELTQDIEGVRGSIIETVDLRSGSISFAILEHGERPMRWTLFGTRVVSGDGKFDGSKLVAPGASVTLFLGSVDLGVTNRDDPSINFPFHMTSVGSSYACRNAKGEEGLNYPSLKEIRSKKNGECAHLRDANLRGADLRGFNLQGAVIEQSDLSHARLERANLFQTTLREVELGGARLKNADLRRTRWQRVYGSNDAPVDLTGANLQGAALDVYLKGGSLRNAVLDGAAWIAGGLEKTDLSEASLVGTSFASSRVYISAGTSFRDADLRDVDFTGCQMAPYRLILTGAKYNVGMKFPYPFNREYSRRFDEYAREYGMIKVD